MCVCVCVGGVDGCVCAWMDVCVDGCVHVCGVCIIEENSINGILYAGMWHSCIV